MIYTLYGEDTFGINKFINDLMKKEQIEDKITYDYEECNIKDVLEECSYNDLFGNKKLVVLNNANFLTGKTTLNDDSLESYINNPNELTILILKVNEDKLDERKKLVKLLKEKSTVKLFLSLDVKDINAYIKNYFTSEDYKIDNTTISLIASRINGNTKVLNSELNKLMLYKINDKTITKEDVLKVITKYEEDNIFKLVDAVIKKDKPSIFTLYKGLIDNKEEPAVIMSLLSNNLRIILQSGILYKDGYSKDKIASYLKEHPYRISLALENSRLIEKKELINDLNKLAILDYQIKSGEVDRFKGLEAFFIEL